MFTRNMTIADYDPVLWQAIQDENVVEEHIELIASENYTRSTCDGSSRFTIH